MRIQPQQIMPTGAPPAMDDRGDENLTSAEVAQILRRSPGTLANWRVKNKGPRFSRPGGVGGPVLYKRRDVETFQRAHTVETEQ